MAGFGILSYISTIILVVVLVLATIFVYFLLQLFLFAREDYLQIAAGGVSMIPVFMDTSTPKN